MNARSPILITSAVVALFCASAALWLFAAPTSVTQTERCRVLQPARVSATDVFPGNAAPDETTHALDAVLRETIERRDPASISAPAHMESAKTKAAIDAIGGESLDDMIERLNKETEFDYAGVFSPRKSSQDDIHIVLGNRRFLRLMSVLDTMPAEDARAYCVDAFARAFGAHRVNLDAVLQKCQTPEDASVQAVSGFPSKYGVSAAILLSARFCGVDATVEQIQAMDEYHKTLKTRMAGMGGLPDLLETIVNEHCCLQNRLKLNALLYATRVDRALDPKRKAEVATISALCRRDTVLLSAWNAAVSSYDPLHTRDGVPIDVSRGVEEFTVYDWTEETFHQEAAQEALIGRLLHALGT